MKIYNLILEGIQNAYVDLFFEKIDFDLAWDIPDLLDAGMEDHLSFIEDAIRVWANA